MIITCPPGITEDVVNRFRGFGAYETDLSLERFVKDNGFRESTPELEELELSSNDPSVVRLLYGTKVVYIVPSTLIANVGFADMAVVDEETTDEFFMLDGKLRRELRMNVLLDGPDTTRAPDGRVKSWPSLSNVIDLLG